MKIMKKKYKSAIVHFNKIKNVTPPPQAIPRVRGSKSEYRNRPQQTV